MKKDKILAYLLMALPIIDFISGALTWNNMPNIGLIFKVLILCFATYYLLKSKDKKIYITLGIIFIYSLITSIFYLLTNRSILINEVSNIIKLFFLPIMLLFMYKYESKYINNKLIYIIYITYLLLYLIPYPFNLGHNISEVYPNKDLYMSYFYIGNELPNIFVLLLPVVINYSLKNIKLFISLVLLLIPMLILMGTKTMYLSILIILIFFLIYKREYLKKYKYFIIGGLVSFTLLGVLLIPNSDFVKNINTTLEYYNVNNINDLLTRENIDNVIFSNRLDFLNDVNEYYQSSNTLTKLTGISRTKLDNIKNVEIDIFDIFYSIGIIGTIIYLIVMIFTFTQIKYNTINLFSTVFIILISCITGHVLISPMVEIYIALLANKKVGI